MDMSDYRPIPEADEDTFRELVHYAFSLEDGPFDDTASDPEPTIGDRRGLYDGNLSAVCRHYHLPVELRASVIEAGGIGAVASDPGQRREGHVQELLAASLTEYRDRDWRLAFLWPFDVGFYANMGWATASKLATWEISPADLDGMAAVDAGTGRFERLHADDWHRLEPVQRADHDTALAVRRDEGWWREFVFDRYDKTPYVYGWIVDDDVRGYLVYTVQSGDDGRTLVVREQAALDTAARRQLFRFCRDHDSQVNQIRFSTPAEAVTGDGFDPHLYLDDPGACDATVTAGAMVRLVDVKTDLPEIGDSTATTARFDLIVSDPLADWNDGRFQVTVGDDGIEHSIRASSASQSETVPTAKLGIGLLSQVAIGAQSANKLAHTGQITGDNKAIDALDDCFQPTQPMMRESF